MIERERVMQRLEKARHKRCLVVQGPPGCGKTSLLARWRQQLLGDDFDVAWLALEPDDRQPMRFLRGLLACLAEVDPQWAHEAGLMLARQGDAGADELWLIELVQRIDARARDIVLVLDDMQHLAGERTGSALQWLLDHAPRNLRLYLASRGPLLIDLGRLRDQAQVEEFRAEDLHFTKAETRAFLQQQLPTISERQVAEIHSLTEGWIAGLQLFATQLKSGRHQPRLRRDAKALSAYFEAEVLEQLAPDDLDTLMRCAIAQRFSASLCATLESQPRSVACMSLRLSALESRNLFVTQAAGQGAEAWYRIHPLLREVLQARLRDRATIDLAGLHAIACRWFDSHDCHEEAVRHAVAAGQPELAANVVERWAPGMLQHGALSQLGAMLVLLPEAIVRQRFHLRLLVAQLRLYGRNLGAVDGDVHDLEMHAGPLSAAHRFAVTLLKGGLAIQRDDSDTVRMLQGELAGPPPDATPTMRVRAGHILSWMYANQGRCDEARTLLEQGDSQESSPDRRLVSASLRGLSYALEGRMAQAERVLRQVLQQARSMPDIDPSIACVAAGLLCESVYEANDLASALQLAAGQTALLERAAIPDAVLRALLTTAAVHRLAGSDDKAAAALDRLETYALRHALDRLLAHALALRLRWCLKDGHSDEAQVLMRRLEALAQRHRHTEPGTHQEILRMAERARARIEMHWNDFGSAADRLAAVLSAAQAATRWREVASIHLALAIAEQGRGRPSIATAHVREALALGHRLGLLRSLLDVGATVPALIEGWLALQPADPVHAFYARRLLTAVRDTQAIFPHAANKPAEPLDAPNGFSSREREVLTLAGQAMSNKKIALVLGLTPHTVKFHLSKVYQKLGVSGRGQAISRLRAMGPGEPGRAAH